MAALSTSFLPIIKDNSILRPSSLEPPHQYLSRITSYPLSTRPRRSFALRSSSNRGSGAGLFVSGFVLGGLLAGTLGCVYAPQISEALMGAERNNLKKKLPEFAHDEEKEVEVTIDEEEDVEVTIDDEKDVEKIREALAKKIAQLNAQLDGRSS